MPERNPHRYRLPCSALRAALLLLVLAACGQQPGLGRGGASNSGDRSAVNDSPAPRSTPRRSDAPLPQPTIVVPEVVNDVTVVRLIDDLRARGITMEPEADSRVWLLRDTPGQVYTGTFSGWLHVHLYPSTEAAARDVPRITREFEAGLPTVDWVDAVHLYRRDALVGSSDV